MIEARNEKDKDKQHSDLLIKVGRFQYMLILFITIGFTFAGKAFINIWAGKEYSLAYYVALFLMMSLVLILPHNLSNEIRKAKNKHKVQ
jgi:O-antigen/teichoic acid export membrane protein